MKSAWVELKKNKAAGPDGSEIKMLAALDYFGIDKITDMINKIYDRGGMLEDLRISVVKLFSKSSGTNNQHNVPHHQKYKPDFE